VWAKDEAGGCSTAWRPPAQAACASRWAVRSCVQAQARRTKTQLASARARWEALYVSEAQFTISESFTLGWLNVLLRHLWPTILEKEFAELASRSIRASRRLKPPPPSPTLDPASPAALVARCSFGHAFKDHSRERMVRGARGVFHKPGVSLSKVSRAPTLRTCWSAS
jgi:hypothetical protein